MPTSRSLEQFEGSKFIFIHIPKTAGVSMTAAISSYVVPYENDLALRESIINRSYDLIGRYQGVLFWHITMDDIRAFYGDAVIDEFYSFAFVRNPWDWLVSMYFFTKDNKAHPESMVCGHMTFKQFLRFFAAKNVTQCSFVNSNGRPSVTEIFRFEELPKALSIISEKTGLSFNDFPAENASSHDRYHKYYDQEDVEFVRVHFADDIKVGGYEFDWGGGGAYPLEPSQVESKTVDLNDLSVATDKKVEVGSRPAANSVKRKLILHVGTHKTGSTAIQTRLQALSEGEGAVHYIPPTGAFYELMDAEKVADDLVRAIREYVDRGAFYQHIEKYVLSFEGFSGNPFLGYPNVNVIAESLFKALGDLFDITVVIYIRRQDQFIESIYSQVAKSIAPPSFADFLSSVPPDSYRWDEFIEKWQRFFGRENIRVLVYSKSSLDKLGGIFKSFLSVLDINDIEDHDRVRVDNPSLSRKAIDIARLVAPRLTAEEIKKLRPVLEAYSLEHKTFYPHFSRPERLRLLDRFEDSNERVRREFFCDRSVLFDLGFEDCVDYEYPGLKESDLLDALVYSIKMAV